MQQAMSPTFNKKDTGPIPTMEFPVAIRAIMDNKKIHSIDWADKGYYGILAEGRLKLHKPDGKLYDWIISDGDLFAQDWITL